MRLPIRARLTLISTALMAAVLVAAGAFLYLRLRGDLRQAVDAGLRPRAEALVGELGRTSAPLGSGGTLIEADEAFAQVLGNDGTVIDSSPGLVGRGPLVEPSLLEGLTGPRFFDADVRTIEEPVPARLLAVPAEGGRVVVVGASLEDQREALDRLAVLLAVGGPVALALAAGVGWLVAGAALRPVERMRSEAAAISAADVAKRLPVPATGDELARLGETLNEMLGRLEDALERERRFVGDGSHELRTPLANLKAEIELALRRSRTQEQLVDALRSAGQETERLVRLAEDLLVLARTDRGGLPVDREPVDLADLVTSEAESFALRASERGIAIRTDVPDGLEARVDPRRMRQALGNLLDNAIRHSAAGGAVDVEARVRDGWLSLEVRDGGAGFPEGFLPRAFEPFARADPSRSRIEGGTGLGLAIVRAVAEAHGGTAGARNLPRGGAAVTVAIPVEPLIGGSRSSHPG
jgi:two-component system OmpR family sensor kinase